MFIVSSVVYLLLRAAEIPNTICTHLRLFKLFDEAVLGIVSRADIGEYLDIVNITGVCVLMTVILIVVGAARSRCLGSFLYNRIIKRNREYDHRAAINGRKMRDLRKIANDVPMESIIFDSMYHTKLICLTLKNDKVYVGNIGSSVDYYARCRDIVVFPWYSGYRDAMRRITLVTDYAAIYRKGNGEKMDANLFRIVIPYSEVQSVSLFDYEIYRKNKVKDPEKKSVRQLRAVKR